MITFVAKQCPEIMHTYITEKASELSVRITMATLDKERIAHCYRCPQRFGIRKVGVGRYACLQHSEEDKAKSA